VRYGFSMTIHPEDVERAKKRIWSDNTKISWTSDATTKPMLFNFMIVNVYEYIASNRELIDWLARDQIDLYFDEDDMQDFIVGDWERFSSSMSEESQRLIGGRPQFRNDEKYVQLQAADFWAWWVRKGFDEDNFPAIQAGDCGAWKDAAISTISFAFTEDQLVEMLMSWQEDKLGLRRIYDANVTPRSQNMLASADLENRQHIKKYLDRLVHRFRKGLGIE
jgi:hypothetical protein